MDPDAEQELDDLDAELRALRAAIDAAYEAGIVAADETFTDENNRLGDLYAFVLWSLGSLTVVGSFTWPYLAWLGVISVGVAGAALILTPVLITLVSAYVWLKVRQKRTEVRDATAEIKASLARQRNEQKARVFFRLEHVARLRQQIAAGDQSQGRLLP